MAASVVAELPSTPESNASPVAASLQTYASDHDRAEQALTGSSEEMESQPQIRNRQLHGQSRRASGESDRRPQAVEPPSNPSSSEANENPEGRPASWRRRLSELVPNPFSTPAHPESIKHERGYENFKYERLEKYAPGIPRFAALHNSNDTFSVYRRFGPYAARILLHQELELNKLATELDELDAEDAKDPHRLHRLQSIDDDVDWDSAKRILLKKMQDKLSEYYDFLLKYVDVRSLDQATQRSSRCIYDWMVDNRPLEETEGDYLLHVDDMVLSRRSTGRRDLHSNRIEDFLESYASRRPRSFLSSLLKTKHERGKAADPLVHHFSNSRLAIFANAITVFLAVGGLLIPVFLLFLVPMYRGLMATVALGSVLAFSVIMSVVTGARIQDVLVGTAGYSAVVVMFLGNLNQVSGSK